ncbi:hypothetical protein DOY81_010497 [Sarcophaga bullata]|nr:hypothetical protein DOY81_010497 [Sarcophaga bullata]
MLVHSNASPTPTPGPIASTSNTLEPVNTSTNSSSSQLHQHLQQSSSLLFSLQQPQQMGCISTLNSRPPSRAPSILDSPTLARVERARLKLEASAQPQHNINGSCCSISNTFNGEDSLERVVLDPNKKEVPWHQVWTHMKRLSHASKVNSSTTICSQKTDITAAGKSLELPDNRASLKDTTSVQQVFSRPDMVGPFL